MENKNIIAKNVLNNNFKVLSHLNAIDEFKTPLIDFFKEKFNLKNLKYIGATAVSVSASLFLINVINEKIKIFDLAQDKKMIPYIEMAKKNSLDFEMQREISPDERRIALEEYYKWIKDSHSQEKTILNTLSDSVEIVDETPSNSYINQRKYSLKSLKDIHPKNEKYYSIEYNQKIPTLSELDIIGEPYGVSGKILHSIMLKESKGNTEAISQVGARGAFQSLIETAKEFKLISEKGNFISNGYASADKAARYLLWVNKYVNGVSADLNNDKNLRYALAAYNAGISKVKKGNIKRIPNYTETKEYIRDIMLLVNNEGHFVNPNENIYQIAKKYEISVENLIRNNIDLLFYGNEALKSGTILDIRDNSNQNMEITIDEGFNLWRLSQILNVDLKKIAEHNNISLDQIDHLQKGDSIVIPALETAAVNKNNQKIRI